MNQNHHTVIQRLQVRLLQLLREELLLAPSHEQHLVPAAELQLKLSADEIVVKAHSRAGQPEVTYTWGLRDLKELQRQQEERMRLHQQQQTAAPLESTGFSLQPRWPVQSSGHETRAWEHAALSTPPLDNWVNWLQEQLFAPGRRRLDETGAVNPRVIFSTLADVAEEWRELIRWCAKAHQQLGGDVMHVLWFFTLLVLDDQWLTQHLDAVVKARYSSEAYDELEMIDRVEQELNKNLLEVSLPGFSKVFNSWTRQLHQQEATHGRENNVRDAGRVLYFVTSVLHGTLPDQKLNGKWVERLDPSVLETESRVWSQVLSSDPRAAALQQAPAVTELSSQWLEPRCPDEQELERPALELVISFLKHRGDGMRNFMPSLFRVVQVVQAPWAGVLYYLALIAPTGDTQPHLPKKLADFIEQMPTPEDHAATDTRLLACSALEVQCGGFGAPRHWAVLDHEQYPRWIKALMLLEDALALGAFPYQEKALVAPSALSAEGQKYHDRLHDLFAELIVPALTRKPDDVPSKPTGEQPSASPSEASS